jgi:hypothetical protein
MRVRLEFVSDPHIDRRRLKFKSSVGVSLTIVPSLVFATDWTFYSLYFSPLFFISFFIIVSLLLCDEGT